MSSDNSCSSKAQARAKRKGGSPGTVLDSMLRPQEPGRKPQLAEVLQRLEAQREVVNELLILSRGAASAHINHRVATLDAELVEEMIALDQLAGLGGQDRIARKAAIASIEALLQKVDRIKNRLAVLEGGSEGGGRPLGPGRTHALQVEAPRPLQNPAESLGELSEVGIGRLTSVLQQLEAMR